jgi:hypothetical protein
MRKIGLQQSFTGLFPDSGNTVSLISLVINPPKNFHDSTWRYDAHKSIDAYAACNFLLIHLTIQMPK